MRKLTKVGKMVSILGSDKKNVGKISFVVTKRTPPPKNVSNKYSACQSKHCTKVKQGRFYLRLLPWQRQTEFTFAKTKRERVLSSGVSLWKNTGRLLGKAGCVQHITLFLSLQIFFSVIRLAVS